jgi:hypothetical protein
MSPALLEATNRILFRVLVAPCGAFQWGVRTGGAREMVTSNRNGMSRKVCSILAAKTVIQLKEGATRLRPATPSGQTADMTICNRTKPTNVYLLPPDHQQLVCYQSVQ